MDPVIVSGDRVQGILGHQKENYGLFVSSKGALQPIPFQIDERDKSGEFVLTGGKDAGEDEDRGLFDENDELVFYAKDAGDRIKTESVPKTASASWEITVTDPLSRKQGWAYLLLFPSPPERSSVDYGNYSPEQMEIRMHNFITGYTELLKAAPAKYAFTREIGGDEQDILDRVKIRMHIKTIITLNRNEEDVKVKELGYIDGPVRVITRDKYKINLILGIPASTWETERYYYYCFADFPVVMSLPMRPTKLHVKIYDDFIDSRGWKLFSDTNPAGHTVDGETTGENDGLDLSPWKWSVLSNDRFSFWSLAIYPPGVPDNTLLYYIDDPERVDPNEDVNGELPGLGNNFLHNWDEVESYPQTIILRHFLMEAYRPGDEKAVVNIQDHPLTVDGKAL